PARHGVSDADRRTLAGGLCTYGQAPHAAALAVIVVYRAVLRAAVVPDGQRARLPAHAAGELGPGLMRLQEVDERAALLLAHVLEADGMAAADVQRPAAGVGMGARRRMLGFVLVGVVGVVHLHAADGRVHLAAAATSLEARAVHADQLVDHGAHAIG